MVRRSVGCDGIISCLLFLSTIFLHTVHAGVNFPWRFLNSCIFDPCPSSSGFFAQIWSDHPSNVVDHLLKAFDHYASTLPCGYRRQYEMTFDQNLFSLLLIKIDHQWQRTTFWISECIARHCKYSFRNYQFFANSLSQETFLKLSLWNVVSYQFCIKCLDQHQHQNCQVWKSN